jgi:hypothetical protein
MAYYRHPTLTGDTTITIATRTGAVTRPVVDGVVDWPDDAPAPGVPWQPSEAPERLRALRAAEERAQLEMVAAKLGLTVVPATADAAPADAAPPAAEKPRRAKG